MSLNITVKFKNETEKYELLDNAVVEDLMKAIEERTQIPINHQKVIFPINATVFFQVTSYIVCSFICISHPL